MLLEFSVKNYKSFYEKSTFSMLAAPKQKGLDYSLLKTRMKRKEIKALCSSVIYGPNAAGKTNIIGAMDTFRSIVLRGHIKNPDEANTPNEASTSLELIPNSTKANAEPVEFEIDFIENNTHVQYSLSIDLGTFLDVDYPRKIIYEKLIINDETVFVRDDELTITIPEKWQKKMHISPDYIGSSIIIARNSLDPEELFLSNGFKFIFSSALAKFILEWFANKLMVIYRADSMTLIKRFADPQKKCIYIDKTLQHAASIFGINSNAIGYVTGEDDTEPRLCSLLTTPKEKRELAVSAELFESYGTVRFINLFPLVIRALLTGSTLVVDEFDASIHPMAVMNILNIFHNDTINVNHAQLIINTHNPIFLNSNLLRRDEIKFVERDEDTHISSLYALSDFGTTGENGVRKHEDYLKNYFIDQYGAISDIDFTPLFEHILENASEV